MTGTFLNFFKCNLTNDNIEVMKTDYIDEENYKELQMENKEFFFYRIGSDIYFWNKTKEEKMPSFNYIKVHMSLKDYPIIFKIIISNGLAEFFKLRGAEVNRKNYSSLLEINSNKNIADGYISGITINDIRLLDTFYSSQDKVIGITLSTKLKYKFLWNKNEFIHKGIDVADLKYENEIIFPTKKAVERLIDSTNSRERYNSLKYKYEDNKEIYKNIISTAQFINNNIKGIFFHKDFSINSIDIKCLPYSNEIFKVDSLSNPEHYYYCGRTISGIKYNEAVKKLRPYSYEIFSNQNINIAVLSPREYEGTTENFMEKLKRKITDIFHLNVNFEIILVNGKDVNSYGTILYKDILKNKEKYKMAIIILEEGLKKLNVESSPYHFCKAKLIGQGITSQEILIEKMKKTNDFILNNIALNIYAKLGGTSWTIEKIEKQKQELIIGISSCFDKNKNRIFGISQVFNYDGNYLVTECSPLTTIENYKEVFEKYLRKTLQEVIDAHIDKSKEFRLIFHLNKTPGKKSEIAAIYNVLQEFSDVKFKYALVHLNYNHNFKLFTNEGKYFNKKGLYINIDSNKTLLSLVDRSINPLLVDIDMRSSFIDKDYITKQIYWFCHLSYRSFMIPAKKTVTMQYPYLITKLTNELRCINDWDYQVLSNLGDKLWFI